MSVSPDEYEQSAVLHHEMAKDMMDRLAWMTVQPQSILNLSGKTGQLTDALKQRYPNALVVTHDSDAEFLAYAQAKQQGDVFVQSRLDALPFSTRAFDMIVANMVLPWQEEMVSWLTDMRTFLREHGVLMISTIGPASLPGMQAGCCAQDMHDLGDAMLQAGWVDPVLDTDYLTFSYQNKHDFVRDMAVCGFLCDEEDVPNHLQASFELVYAHAFQSGDALTVPGNYEGSARFPLSYLRQRLTR